ncbi:MAG: hypothetical protein J7521_22535 [Caulobacter sp.]|nr:hypothetical protein [Caulobacter sp.]
MSTIRIEATQGGWRVLHGKALVTTLADEADAFRAALDYCSQLFLLGVRARVELDKPSAFAA